MLFCDLVGSTALAARLDPEDLREVIRAYQAACAEVIGRLEGHVAKYLGDGVLAYFGWPQAHEDEAERAVRAGLQLVDAVGRLEHPRRRARAPARGSGIATGHGRGRRPDRRGRGAEEAVVGETPNLAARLQALAEPGAVVMAASTRRLLGGLFALADLGPVRLKGFAEPLAAWRVEGEGRAEGRFEALHGGHLTPLVGREHELGILLDAGAGPKTAMARSCCSSGEPGIGKSRLRPGAARGAERRAACRAQLYYCSPHHTNSPLHPIITQLDRAAAL